MRVITYVCDRCGHSQTDETTPREMLTATLTIGPGASPPGYLRQTIHEVMWCKPCYDATGIKVPTKAAPQPNNPTFEDLVRDMISDIVAEQVR